MRLVIRVVGFKAKRLATNLRLEIDDDGSSKSIGRALENDLVLGDDPSVSSVHAEVYFDNDHGGFFLDDHSTNGTAVETLSELLHNNRTQVFDRDIVYIGDYQLLVRDVDELRSEESSRQVMRSARQGEVRTNTKNSYLYPGLAEDSLSDVKPDVLDLTLADEDSDNRVGFEGPDSEDAPTREDKDVDVDPAAVSPTQPENTEDAGVEVPSRPNRDLVAALLRGAGVEGAINQDPERFMEEIGAFMHIVVEGLLFMLETRSEILENFGVPLTRARRGAQQSALAPFRSTTEALSVLLVGKGEDSESARDTVANALTKLAAHERAVANGYIECLRFVVKEFAPEQVSEHFQEYDGLLEKALVGKWAKYERYYKQRSHELIHRNFQASRLSEIFKEEYRKTMTGSGDADRREP